ncbi:MAG: MarR family transcriptional regulator [Micropruina sp.]
MRDHVAFFDTLLRYEIQLWNALDGAVQREHGLSLGRLRALRVLRERGGRARVQDLADDLLITVGAASKLVDRLERDGTAHREPNPDDRRSSLIALTPSGTSVLDAGLATFEATLADCLAVEGAAEGDLAPITARLQRLLDHLESRTRAGVAS